MLVYLHQYRESDANERVGGETSDTDAESYFGEQLESTDDWESVEYGDREILRRALTFEEVTAVSVPRDVEEPDEEIPGVTVQLRKDGDEEYVDDAVVVEVTDENP
ncbi:hypothetical protein AUR64_11200 [Haloprofundus marisrubri]|uniref:Uncharacterized protein n=1 Tax=Haloprofundus marisrubri TaxID=1514971 RepID=A0A0W1RAK6_9EURY|nr:hypothetical protein [Haloprofundus marisrubri]KTG10509.1 hypothetical protein AUR64_11200 [Haloprofundus marisrubri]